MPSPAASAVACGQGERLDRPRHQAHLAIDGGQASHGADDCGEDGAVVAGAASQMQHALVQTQIELIKEVCQVLAALARWHYVNPGKTARC